MIRKILIASIAAAAAGTAAQAQDAGWNAGAGYERAEFPGGALDTVVLRGGYDFNRNFGIEGQANFGIGDSERTIAGINTSTELNYSVGVFGIARLPVGDDSSFFGRLGYVQTELEVSAGAVSAKADDNAIAWGVGFDTFQGPNGLRVEYTRGDYDDGGNADTFGVSYVRRFGG